MKLYTKNGFEYFYDPGQRLWLLYAVNNFGERIEWDKDGNPIEVEYFNNKTELNTFLNK